MNNDFVPSFAGINSPVIDIPSYSEIEEFLYSRTDSALGKYLTSGLVDPYSTEFVTKTELFQLWAKEQCNGGGVLTQQALNDLKAIRTVLLYAISAKHAISSGETPKDIISDHAEISLHQSVRNDSVWILSISLNPGYYAEYLLKQFQAVDGSSIFHENIFGFRWFMHDQNEMTEAINDANSVFDTGIRHKPYYFHTIIRIDSPSRAKKQIELMQKVTDSLFSLHLSHVATVSMNGGVEARLFDSVLAAYWWKVLDSFRLGTIDRCVECGKPFVSHARGTKRLYCSNACKQRAKKKRKARLVQE